MTIDAWVDALLDRHTASLSAAEFNRALRALSARYVERRGELPGRSPLDSAGKRAAFAGFYAPLHTVTTLEVMRALAVADGPVETLVDLGCGTGAASAAWALAARGPIRIDGIDADAWAIAEARWSWKTLGIAGRARRGDLGRALETLVSRAPARLSRTAILAGWSVNELDAGARSRLLPLVLSAVRRGAALLMLEPLSRAAVPWWPEWAAALGAEGSREDEWKFDVALPPRLAAIDRGAGFSREHLGVRSLWRPSNR